MSRLTCSLHLAAVVSLLVACSDSPTTPAMGAIRVTLATTGEQIDLSGYTIQVDGGSFQRISPNQQIWITEVVAGDHSVTLGEIADNCTVGQNPVGVLVPGRDTVEIVFRIGCSATVGRLLIQTVSSGRFVDPDGYVVSVDDSWSRSLNPTSAAAAPQLERGSHQVALTGVAANCTVVTPNPVAVDITPGSTSSVEFRIDCSRAPPIAFLSAGRLVVVNPDGSGRRVLLPDAFSLRGPQWSPDGTKIAFLSDSALHVLDLATSQVAQLTREISIQHFQWAPNGRLLALSFDDCSGWIDPDYGCLKSAVGIIHADGGGFTRLRPGYRPNWSPDSRTIAFVHNEGEIYTVSADGSGLSRLPAPSPAYVPTWSPDGTRIAFLKQNSESLWEIFVIRSDGTGLVNLTQGRGNDPRYVWSPDGSRIAFLTALGLFGIDKIGVARADGTGRAILTHEERREYDPAWSPDGSHIVFSGSVPSRMDSEIYVVSAEGGTARNVSNRPDSSDHTPTWSSK